MKRTLSIICLFSGMTIGANADLQKDFNYEVSLPSYFNIDAKKIQFLLDQDPKIDVNQCVDIYSKSTPIMHAVRTGDIELVKLLVQHGADIHAKNVSGSTALFYALNVDIVTYLVDQGADVNHIDMYGQTLLFEAVLSRNIEMVQFLLHKGLNINHQNNKGETVLMRIAALPFASYYNMYENDAETIAMIKFLLKNNADVNLKDKDGSRVLSLVEAEGFFETAQLLKDAGAIK